MIHANLTFEQFGLINRCVIAHQKQMNSSLASMTKKKNLKGQSRAKVRCNLMLIGSNQSELGSS